MVTRVVSMIGIASTSSGSITVATVVPAAVQLAARPMLASVKPRSWLPASPMNTLALRPSRRLYGRKPMHAKPSESARARTRSLPWTVAASIAK